MLEDCSNFSVEEPLVIGEALLQFGANATQTFLKHVYQHHPVSSHEEAQQLLSMAHLLDAPSLMKKAVSYIFSKPLASLLGLSIGYCWQIVSI